jgi:predicted XRE-type DNA-binding protein
LRSRGSGTPRSNRSAAGRGDEAAIAVRWTRGNVFADLGRSPADAANLMLRAQLMVQLTVLIEERKLTQSAAAKLLGVTQPRVSDLTRGKIQLFSIDSLVEMLARAGMRVEATVRKAA